MAITLTIKRFADDPAVLQETGVWPQPWPVLSLSLEDRQRSRLAAMLPNGRAVAVLLPRGEQMQHGDVLCGEQGERVLVQAAVQELMQIQATSMYELMRAMLKVDAVLIEPDPVLAEMVRGLGGAVTLVQEPFIPEGGAYASGQGGGGHHHHSHPDECGLEAHDQAMGNLGEELSIAAHARNKR
jgi:urease accessory protein